MKNLYDTPERVAWRKTMEDFVAREITPYAQEWDEAGTTPWALHEKLGALGMFGFGIDEKYGGLGFDDPFMRLDTTIAMSKCGAGGVPAAIGGRGISLDPIQKLADPDIAARVLPEIIAGRKGSSLAITEPGGGSDVAALKTTARRNGNSWVLNGSKTFITGGMESNYFVVAARTGGPGLTGISLFFVEADAPGFSRTVLGKKMGWWASNQATLYFDDCRVPANALMGQENMGFLQIMNNFNMERLTLAAWALGMMEVCYEDSLAWARERETFGKTLNRHQVIRHKLVDMSMKIDATAAYLWQVTRQLEQAWKGEGDLPVAKISKLKVFATTNLEWVASAAMQILGGAGYLRGNRVENVYREVKVIAIGGGSEEIMRDLAAKQMGI